MASVAGDGQVKNLDESCFTRLNVISISQCEEPDFKMQLWYGRLLSASHKNVLFSHRTEIANVN